MRASLGFSDQKINYLRRKSRYVTPDPRRGSRGPPFAVAPFRPPCHDAPVTGAYHDRTYRRRRHRRADAGAQPAPDRHCRQSVRERAGAEAARRRHQRAAARRARADRTRPARHSSTHRACAPGNWRIFSKHGKPIWSEPRGIEAGYKWPQFSIHRGTLQQILLDAVIERLGADNILTSHHLAGWTETADGVRADFIDKATGSRRAATTARS